MTDHELRTLAKSQGLTASKEKGRWYIARNGMAQTYSLLGLTAEYAEAWLRMPSAVRRQTVDRAIENQFKLVRKRGTENK